MAVSDQPGHQSWSFKMCMQPIILSSITLPTDMEPRNSVIGEIRNDFLIYLKTPILGVHTQCGLKLPSAIRLSYKYLSTSLNCIKLMKWVPFECKTSMFGQSPPSVTQPSQSLWYYLAIPNLNRFRQSLCRLRTQWQIWQRPCALQVLMPEWERFAQTQCLHRIAIFFT